MAEPEPTEFSPCCARCGAALAVVAEMYWRKNTPLPAEFVYRGIRFQMTPVERPVVKELEGMV